MPTQASIDQLIDWCDQNISEKMYYVPSATTGGSSWIVGGHGWEISIIGNGYPIHVVIDDPELFTLVTLKFSEVITG